MLLRIVATVLALALASASPIAQSIQNDPVTPQFPQQVTLNICPQLSVRCVTEGDWLHPIGYLGKRREYDRSEGAAVDSLAFLTG
jgi:hypothetical protein